MSLGWIIVIVMGFVPLLLVYLTSGNTEENQPRRDGARNDTAPRSTKKKNFVYSSWRVVLVVNSLLDDSMENIKEQYAALLSRIAQECELYLVGQVKSDQEEQKIVEKVSQKTETLSLVDAGLNVNKILFCETDRGKIAIARQLEPDIYVDVDETVVTELARFLPLVAMLNPTLSTTTKTQHKVTSPSLTDLFEAIQNKKI